VTIIPMDLPCCSPTSTHPSHRVSKAKEFKLICGELGNIMTGDPQLQLNCSCSCLYSRWLGIRAHHLMELRDKRPTIEGGEGWDEAEHLQLLSSLDHRKLRAMLLSDAIQVGDHDIVTMQRTVFINNCDDQRLRVCPITSQSFSR